MNVSEPLGARSPSVARAVPGTMGAALLDALANAECPALTARRARRNERSGAPQDPIVWAEAAGANVVDVDGNVYVDLTAGFGVAALGHRHPSVVEAVRRQSDRLLHALGDVHPSDVKIALLERLTALAPFPDARAILVSDGSDAVEAALQTAWLHTRRPGVLAFEGGYHGLSLGALAVCGYQPAFRAPFSAQLGGHAVFARFPRASDAVAQALDEVAGALESSPLPVGALLVEPILGRGGVVVPPAGFLRGLAELARAHGALLVVDEIWTGLHRTGPRWACLDEGVEPDVLCVGKALGGGMPIAACLAPAAVLRAWGDPAGEALRTSTFASHPIACAAALAHLEAMRAHSALEDHVRATGAWLLEALRARLEAMPGVVEVRGRGLAVGIALGSGRAGLRVVRALLERGFLVLPAAPDASVVQISPPLTIARALLERFVEAAADAIASVAETKDVASAGTGSP